MAPWAYQTLAIVVRQLEPAADGIEHRPDERHEDRERERGTEEGPDVLHDSGFHVVVPDVLDDDDEDDGSEESSEDDDEDHQQGATSGPC